MASIAKISDARRSCATSDLSRLKPLSAGLTVSTQAISSSTEQSSDPSFGT
jgi:hypothetical protein